MPITSERETVGRAWTPGPWDATTRRGSWDWVVYSVADPNIEICQPFHDGTEFNEIGEANARLIAAAPDLYEALAKAEELYLVGLLNAPDGLADEVVRLRRTALSRVEVDHG